MKWSVVGLLVLGLAAAVCAAILAASLRTSGTAAADKAPVEEVALLVAARALPALTIVDANSVASKRVPVAEAPAGHLRSPVAVVGKLLCVPVVEGQAFTRACLATEASGAHLATALSDGMRAVSLSLLAENAGLLYPGSVVDVLVSLKIDGCNEAISMTLLHGIEVLAIDDRTVVSAVEDRGKRGVPGPGKRRMITLMVNSDQAEVLQLAAKYGAVSLALRNPLDVEPVDPDATLLSELSDEYSGLLARLAAVPSPVLTGIGPSGPGGSEEKSDQAGKEAMWETVIIRGGEEIETQAFPLPTNGGEPRKG